MRRLVDHYDVIGFVAYQFGFDRMENLPTNQVLFTVHRTMRG